MLSSLACSLSLSLSLSFSLPRPRSLSPLLSMTARAVSIAEKGATCLQWFPDCASGGICFPCFVCSAWVLRMHARHGRPDVLPASVVAWHGRFQSMRGYQPHWCWLGMVSADSHSHEPHVVHVHLAMELVTSPRQCRHEANSALLYVPGSRKASLQAVLPECFTWF